MKKTIGLALIIAVAGAVAVSFAAPGPKGGDRGRGGPCGGGFGGPGGVGMMCRDPEIARSAGVTEEQLTKLRELSYQHQREIIKLQADLQIAELDLEQLKRSGSTDTEALNKAVDAVQQAEGTIEKARIKQMNAVRELLGEETLAKMADAAREMREERREERRGDREGKRGGKGCPGMAGCKMGMRGPCGMTPPPAGDTPPDDGPEGLPED